MGDALITILVLGYILAQIYRNRGQLARWLGNMGHPDNARETTREILELRRDAEDATAKADRLEKDE